jgi:hypothetical protein
MKPPGQEQDMAVQWVPPVHLMPHPPQLFSSELKFVH